MARLQKEKQAAVTTGLAENARPSPRNGFNGCFAFSLVRRLAGHHHEPDTPQASAPLDISIGISGPRDLTVRVSPFVRADQTTLRRHTPIASHCQRLVTVATRPSCGSRDARKCAGDLPDDTRAETATNQHDGQFAHGGHAANSGVIASEAKQSRAPGAALDCFVASLLAMTVANSIRCRRHTMCLEP
ncbi:hypothetical protein BRAO375_600082 [Bradyrhizobium sp. ORS 375]|nr:hypothetical protein BRAO375_600082 [Bradyrhizobium sp. ORS 375]